MKHIDLFSGIGGFALAVDTVWPGSEHIFCDNDPFCQQVLKKHWPNSKIYGDIRTLTNTSGTGTWVEKQNTSGQERQPTQTPQPKVVRQRNGEGYAEGFGTCADILTGGFPCQPFSQAGRRQGTADDRYKWPEMFRVIREFKPTWVIAENVRGLVTWNEGLVLEQVCADLESEGYEVQPLIIPAVAVNAPHRRDRVWFIGYRQHERLERHTVTDKKQEGRQAAARPDAQTGWSCNWPEVATELCGMDDGLSAELDGFKLTKAGHRSNRLKALGNAIVPQVAIEIMQTIKTL